MNSKVLKAGGIHLYKNINENETELSIRCYTAIEAKITGMLQAEKCLSAFALFICFEPMLDFSDEVEESQEIQYYSMTK